MSAALYECHGHALMDGADFRAARARHLGGVDETAVRACLEALQAAGVTYFRDGRGWRDLTEARALIAEAKALRCDFIKLMLSGVITFQTYAELSCESLAPEEIAALAEIAHGEGFAVMAHVNGAETVRAAVEAGIDSIEHGYFLDEGCLRAMAATGCVWVPTVAATNAFIGRAGFDEAVARRTVETQLAMIRRAVSLGVLVAAGSDSGAVGVPHGAGAQTEYRLLRSAGVTEEQMEAANRAVADRFRRA